MTQNAALIAISMTILISLIGVAGIFSGGQALKTSPETTVIAEPLTEDGERDDYFAYGEEQYPADMATDRNGARRLIRTIEPGEKFYPNAVLDTAAEAQTADLFFYPRCDDGKKTPPLIEILMPYLHNRRSIGSALAQRCAWRTVHNAAADAVSDRIAVRRLGTLYKTGELPPSVQILAGIALEKTASCRPIAGKPDAPPTARHEI